MITIFNIIVSIIGALALGFVLSTLTTPDMKSMRRILRVRSIRKRIFVALAIFALVVLYQWLRVCWHGTCSLPLWLYKHGVHHNAYARFGLLKPEL